jgi:hypothetical protein
MATDHDEDEDLANVEVERMPNLDGWEFFKATDAGEGNDRWTLALQHAANRGAIEYAFWTDIKADPAATGVLEARQEADKRWAKALQKAIINSEDSGLDNETRGEVVLAILKRHDPSLDNYEERLLFTLDPPSDEEADDDENDEEDEA